jgi:hypothetical protein
MSGSALTLTDPLFSFDNDSLFTGNPNGSRVAGLFSHSITPQCSGPVQKRAMCLTPLPLEFRNRGGPHQEWNDPCQLTSLNIRDRLSGEVQ